MNTMRTTLRKMTLATLIALTTMGAVCLAAETVAGTKSEYNATDKLLSDEGTVGGREKNTRYDVILEWGTFKAGREKGEKAKWMPNGLFVPIRLTGQANPAPVVYPEAGKVAPTVAEMPRGAVANGTVTHLRTYLKKEVGG